MDDLKAERRCFSVNSEYDIDRNYTNYASLASLACLALPLTAMAVPAQAMWLTGWLPVR